MVHSTRSTDLVTFEQAVNKGLAPDGGLYVFDNYPVININELLNLSYHDMVIYILGKFINVDKIKNSNYPSFDIKLKHISNYSYLELFHGPTAAFKDVALTFLPLLIDEAHIVVATSGDTGSASLSGFSNNPNIDVTVLYPNNLVSPLQEKQMLYFSNERNKAFAYEGNFDDCQRLVKELALKNEKISSANSINIGRLLPQIIYYFYSYVCLVNDKKISLGEKINYSVPTGNFGNILAGYLAKQMGLPVNKFICACNENKVLYDFINTGIYNSNREFIKTYSPSMDILVSSNIERLLYYHYKDTNKVKSLYEEFKNKGIIKLDDYKEVFKDFVSYYVTNEEVLNEIKNEYNKNNYLIDPHTSVAKVAMDKYNSNIYTVVVSTASAYKFEDAISDCGIKLDFNYAPKAIKDAMNTNKEKTVVNKKQVEEYINGKN